MVVKSIEYELYLNQILLTGVTLDTEQIKALMQDDNIQGVLTQLRDITRIVFEGMHAQWGSDNVIEYLQNEIDAYIANRRKTRRNEVIFDNIIASIYDQYGKITNDLDEQLGKANVDITEIIRAPPNNRGLVKNELQ